MSAGAIPEMIGRAARRLRRLPEEVHSRSDLFNGCRSDHDRHTELDDGPFIVRRANRKRCSVAVLTREPALYVAEADARRSSAFERLLCGTRAAVFYGQGKP